MDYKSGPAIGAPLNGQPGRIQIVEAIVRQCGIEQIVETGTYRGASTVWFAGFGLPVHTVEANPRFAHFARLRFAGQSLVQTAEMDSAAFLGRLALDAEATRRITLFYLDAHWGRRLPLADELRTVAPAFPNAIVVVDDFRVEDDTGYGFDNYGPGKSLDLDYVKRAGVPGLVAFFPTLRGVEEDGPRRGCVILTTSEEMAGRLRRLPQLRVYPI